MKFKLPWLSRSNSATRAAGAGRHLTFAHSRMGRTISRTGVMLKKQLWIFPLAAIVVLSGIGYFLHGAIEQTMQNSVHSQLQTLLDVETSMLETWLRSQESAAETNVNDQRVRELVYELLGDQEEEEAPVAAGKGSIHTRLKKELAPRAAAHDFFLYMVLAKDGRLLSADDESLIGRRDLIAQLDTHLKRVMDGETVVVAPFPSRILMEDGLGQLRSGIPVMLVMAPVRDTNFQPVAAMVFHIHPEREFTRILQLGRLGESGETYAFDHEGRMVSNSRFDSDLMLLGLIADEPGSQSILQVLLRDPGGSMLDGHRSKKRRSELPLTKAVTEVLAGRDGADVLGYRDYRGVPVLGAWKALPKYKMGVVTEIDHAEAYRPLSILQWAFWGLYALLAVAAAAIFVFSLVLAKMQREARKAALETQKLGQYTLAEKLGSGGMGAVYKGQHAVLRRSTAIKVLQLDRVSEGSIERFEREVQITCQLNHPNTVQIYDYGHTPEGLFYYAMEYLDGIDLQKLVEQYGPQSESRVIRILQQMCGSLFEAHSLGMVHRDIKPANVMLNRRGGEPDVVKVLDFGLVKAIDDTKQHGLTAAGSLTGTPLYMSPEAIQTPNAVDPRSDLYAVGAVGYFLLTGQPVFDAQSIVDLCQLHVAEPPVPPSQRLGRPIAAELEGAILACLEKSRAKRPQTARDLSLLLSRAAPAMSWSVEEAELWWTQHSRGGGKPAGKRSNPAAKSPANAPIDRTIITDN